MNPRTLDIKKQIEARALDAACRAGLPVPNGEIIPGEEPDFCIENETGLPLGIELTELLPHPRNASFSSPVAEQSLHRDLIELAEEQYYRTTGAVAVKVTAYFWDIERRRGNKRDMAHALANFVRSHAAEANPVVTLSRRDRLPEGFGVVSICADRPGPWWSGESVANTLDGIQQQLGTRIAAKNELLPTYRANLPGSPIWLLLYSCSEVSRSVEIPHGIEDWVFPFDFDRVFFFSVLSGRVVEIRGEISPADSFRQSLVASNG